MFTTNHFQLTYDQLRSVVNDVGDEKSATVALIDAMREASSRIAHLAIQEEGGRVDMLRGAALVLFDILRIIDTQLSAEKERRRNPPDPVVDRRYEV